MSYYEDPWANYRLPIQYRNIVNDKKDIIDEPKRNNLLTPIVSNNNLLPRILIPTGIGSLLMAALLGALRYKLRERRNFLLDDNDLIIDEEV